MCDWVCVCVGVCVDFVVLLEIDTRCAVVVVAFMFRQRLSMAYQLIPLRCVFRSLSLALALVVCVCSVFVFVYFAAGRNLHSLLAIIVCDVSGIIDWPIGQEDDDDEGDLRLMSS